MSDLQNDLWNAVWSGAGLDDNECNSIVDSVTTVFARYETEAADTITALEEENKRLREALRWYADKSNWTRHRIVPKMPCQAVYDSGERARSALEGE